MRVDPPVKPGSDPERPEHAPKHDGGRDMKRHEEEEERRERERRRPEREAEPERRGPEPERQRQEPASGP